MDFNIDVRKKQLESLEQYINSSKLKVQQLLAQLGWSARKVLEEDSSTYCTINPTHKIPFKSAEQHVQKCYTKVLGYDAKEAFLSEPGPSNSESCIKLDNVKKVEILSQAQWEKAPHFRPAWNGYEGDPMTSDRLLATFSPDERLTIYEYCAKNTVGPSVPPDFNVLVSDAKTDEGKELSYEELLIRERDSKRRRAKYKSVHTNRKSHTEVIKEVIENQMEMYKDWLSEINKQNTKPASNQTSITQKKDEDVQNSIKSPEKTPTSRNSSCSRSRSQTRSRTSRERQSRERSRSRFSRNGFKSGNRRQNGSRRRSRSNGRWNNSDRRRRSHSRDRRRSNSRDRRPTRNFRRR